MSPIWTRHRAGLSLSWNSRLQCPREAVALLVLLIRGRNAVSAAKFHEGGTATAADLLIACSLGPPTVSDTSIPTDQFSVGGDYVLILTLPAERENRRNSAV